MYINLPKALAKYGKFKLNLMSQMNKDNIIIMWFVILFLAVIQLVRYIVVFLGWGIYSVFYGIYWCVKKIIK